MVTAPEARGHRESLPGLPEIVNLGFFDGLANLIRGTDDSFKVSLRKNGDKLLAPVSRDKIGGPHGLLHRLADDAQNLISLLMAIGIVEFLEVVHVKNRKTEELLVPDGKHDLLVEFFFESAVILQSGQRVHRGQMVTFSSAI